MSWLSWKCMTAPTRTQREVMYTSSIQSHVLRSCTNTFTMLLYITVSFHFYCLVLGRRGHPW